jgi:hypothetical protein
MPGFAGSLSVDEASRISLLLPDTEKLPAAARTVLQASPNYLPRLSSCFCSHSSQRASEVKIHLSCGGGILTLGMGGAGSEVRPTNPDQYSPDGQGFGAGLGRLIKSYDF